MVLIHNKIYKEITTPTAVTVITSIFEMVTNRGTAITKVVSTEMPWGLFSTCSHASIVLLFSNPHPQHLKKVKEEMKPYSKMEKLIHKDCTKMEEYMTEKSLEDARLEFKWQTGMLDSRAKKKAKYKNSHFPVCCPHCPKGRSVDAPKSPAHSTGWTTAPTGPSDRASTPRWS